MTGTWSNFPPLIPGNYRVLKPTNAILGTLRADIAHEWGLHENVQVVMGSPDMQSAAVGSGAVKD